MRILISILLLIVCHSLSGQTINVPLAPLNINLKNINKTDSLGKKTGYWCKSNDDFIGLDFYENGKRNGISIRYNKTGQNPYGLVACGYYSNGIPACQWMFFYHPNNNISGVVTNISKNTDFIKEAQKTWLSKHEPLMQAYGINYDGNGNIESEGWFIFPADGDFMMDFEYVGVWKYYTPQGVKTKDFSSIIFNSENL